MLKDNRRVRFFSYPPAFSHEGAKPQLLPPQHDLSTLISRIRRFEDEPLRLGEISVIVRIVIAGGPGEGKGRIFEEEGAPLTGPAPGHGAVGQRFGEDDGGTGRTGHGAHEGLKLGQVAPFGGEGQVGLVAAGDTTKAAIPWMHIAQVVRHHGQPVVHATILPVVILAGVKGRAAAMQHRPDRTLPDRRSRGRAGNSGRGCLRALAAPSADRSDRGTACPTSAGRPSACWASRACSRAQYARPRWR